MRWRRSRILKTLSRPPLMALIDPAPIDKRIKELHGKKILITMCLFWLEARFAFCDWLCLKTSRQQSPVHTMEHPSERLETASPNHQGTPGHVTPSGSLRSQTPSYNEVGFVSCFKPFRHILVFWFSFFIQKRNINLHLNCFGCWVCLADYGIK